MINKITDDTFHKIAEWEGCRLRAYKDAGGVWTIGYGHTGGVQEGDIITQDDADKMLRDDIAVFEKHVANYNPLYHWTQNEFDALVSFAFNIGSINQLTDTGTRTKEVIAEKMLLYVHCGNEALPGLIARRNWEHDLFVQKETIKSDNFIHHMAERVIAGEFGNGDERVQRVGRFCYDLIQEEVNKILG